MRTYILGP